MSSDTVQAARGRVRVEACRKRVRALVRGRPALDTIAARYVWEAPYYPTYYVPVQDVAAQLRPTGRTSHSPSRGDAEQYDVVVDGAVSEGAALRYASSPIEELRELVRFDWGAMDEWLEEDEPVYTHARDPYTRVDILASSREVRLEVDGLVVAASSSPRILFETALPPRFYLPMTDVRMDLLERSGTFSHCPYKGTATYWSLAVDGRRYDDFVWTYRSPFPESQKVAGLLCFYNEKVDLYVDGELQERPRTKFS
jgi:uncharacterized protein (DUF427 family)